MAYSIDLRERVVAAFDNGMHTNEITKIFNVCLKTVYNWLALRKKTSNLAPKTGYQKGHNHTITDWNLFESFVKENKQCSTLQLIDKWKILTGVAIDDSVMWRALHKSCHAKKRAFCKTRYNGIAALNAGLLCVPFIFEGNTNSAVYETYVERVEDCYISPNQQHYTLRSAGKPSLSSLRLKK